LSRQIRVKDYRNLKLSESEDLGYIGINETIRKKTTFLVPPFPFVEEDKDKDEKPKATNVIEFLLKQRANSAVTLQHQPKHSRSKVLRRDCCIMD
jgi:hypothetical protein